MVNVLGDSGASRSGNLHVAKKVVATVGQFKDYKDEIRQGYGLGFSIYRLHTNEYGIFVTPIRVYDGDVIVLDDVATMKVGDRHLATDGILIYFVKCGGGGDIVAMQGDRGPSGARGLKGDSGDRRPVIRCSCFYALCASTRTVKRERKLSLFLVHLFSP